jgi:hypothetical protein
MPSKKKSKLKLEPELSSARQSGGDQGLPRVATADSESVEELVQGNAFEAGVVFGVENSKAPGVAEVTAARLSVEKPSAQGTTCDHPGMLAKRLSPPDHAVEVRGI